MIISTNSDQIEDSIRISFTDSNGSKVYPVSVSYTVYDSRGNRVSGLGLFAIKNLSRGNFYASWSPNKPGSYRIVWEYELCCGNKKSVESNFLAVDPSLSGKCIPERDFDPLLEKQFLLPIIINENTFPLHFRDSSGSDVDAHSVEYSLYDSCGKQIQTWTQAQRFSVGFYFASPNVVSSGSYILRWKFQIFESDPPNTKDFLFDALNLCAPPFQLDSNGNPIVASDCSVPVVCENECKCGCSTV